MKKIQQTCLLGFLALFLWGSNSIVAKEKVSNFRNGKESIIYGVKSLQLEKGLQSHVKRDLKSGGKRRFVAGLEQNHKTLKSGEKRRFVAGLEQAHVTRVVDGDTIVVDRGHGQEKVRLILVNTPETVHPNKPVEYYGKEASDFTKAQLTDKEIYLEKDVSDRDRYGRLLRYVWLDRPENKEDLEKKCFNAILLKEGYAQLSTFPPDVKYEHEFLTYQRQAREAEKGLWSTKNESSKTEDRISNAEAEEGSGYGLAYEQANGRIIANKRSMIYHTANDQGYQKVKAKNAVYFTSEEAARQAGFRPAKR